MQLPQGRNSQGTWVQTERAAHEAWAHLIASSPIAAQIMHVLVSQIGEHNAVVISQKNLARLINRTDRSVRNGLKVLEDERWIQVRQIGNRGTVNAYVINDQVAWHGKRDGIRYSIFSASVYVTEDEQSLDHEKRDAEPLRKVPDLFPGERQLPSGEGLPPVSQPALPGYEADLPAITRAKIQSDS